MKGVTDDLFQAIALAASNDEKYKAVLEQIHQRHKTEITALISEPHRSKLLSVIEKDIHELGEILRGVWIVKQASTHISDLVSGMGEVWSAQVLNSYLQSLGLKTDWIDARKIVVINQADQRPNQPVVINWEKSQERMSAWLKHNSCDLVVVTGYVAINESGVITTLGRNGSDFSASIFGSLLKSDEIFIWTDVDGVLSADPRLVPEAMILDEMSYNEVAELAYFGAKVVHPSTIAPAIRDQSTIWIKNTFNPKFPGTKIHGSAKSNRAVTGFSTIDKMCLLNLEGTGMAGVPGVAERLFGSLRAAGVSVVLISQASSEQSICLAVPLVHRDKAKRAIEETFFGEIQRGVIHGVEVTNEVSILAAVGDNMANSSGISGKFFTSLGQSGVNVRAIAQGSSERNISAVIDAVDSTKALRSVHSAFIIPHQRISLGLIGTGLIGGEFLRQLHSQSHFLKKDREIEIQVRGIANSKKMLLMDAGIPLERWQEEFEKNSEPLDLHKFEVHLKPSHMPHAVLIEATASSSLTPNYERWLKSGLHIISPNKKANTGSLAVYNEIREAAKIANRHFLYSTNVGAGLPIIQTLRDLCATGDQVHMIQGILSGTLSFIFNQYTGAKPFSEIVLEAKSKGYTEPDPREDLSGQDVARKLVILAREAGLKLSIEDLKITSLVPEHLQKISTDEFLKRLPEMDQPLLEKMKQAQASAKILRFTASLDPNGDGAQVGLQELPANHAFSRVSGTDNIVLFKTTRYFHQPLIVQGPGAGPEVTAAGVFADLLRLSRYLGANA
jgi:aspartokinase/homoserine dehydrogenase 1